MNAKGANPARRRIANIFARVAGFDAAPART
jgi:hypothetical protein